MSKRSNPKVTPKAKTKPKPKSRFMARGSIHDPEPLEPVVLARHVICILHSDAKAIESAVARFPAFSLDTEYSTSEPDPRMRKAFEASMDRVEASMTEADWTAVDQHTAVTYVFSPPIEPLRSRAISADAVRLCATALAAGAFAVKSESAGIAHGADRWRTLAAELEVEGRRDYALHSAFVRRPIAADDLELYYTCGMHLLGRCDVEISKDLPALDALAWLDAFALYTLVEVSPDELRDGHTFRPDDESTRRRLQRYDCTRYPSDDFFYNPHGYWRLV
ncbi:MAG: hypothetical protein ABI867_45085 [Kofleriaceae bacterium]